MFVINNKDKGFSLNVKKKKKKNNDQSFEF